MSANFPNSPTNGQQFTVGNIIWQWSSTDGVWMVVRNLTVPDAPADSKNYIRKNNSWIELVSSGGSDLGWVTPEMYGAVGNGSTDDTTAVQTAVDTGKNVFLSNKDYKITAAILMQSKTNQRIVGGTLVVIGAIHGIRMRACYSCVIDVSMKCGSQTSSGFALYMDSNCERCRIQKLHILDNGLNGIYVEQANTIHIDWFYAINLRGSFGIRWYGSSSLRSDVLNINFAAIAAHPSNASLYGVYWDGNCNSLTTHNVHTVNCYHGLYVGNNSGGPVPQIGRLSMFATDFSYSHGIYIAAGDDFDFTMPYINGAGYGGAAGCYGMYVGSGGSGSGMVRVFGGKSIGNTGYGLGCGTSGIIYCNGTRMYSNTQGNGINLHTSSVVL